MNMENLWILRALAPSKWVGMGNEGWDGDGEPENTAHLIPPCWYF